MDKAPDWLLEQRANFNSRQKFEETVYNTMNTDSCPETEHWREVTIIEKVITIMHQRQRTKTLMLYGNDHIARFVEILETKGWELKFQRNLKPRT